MHTRWRESRAPPESPRTPARVKQATQFRSARRLHPPRDDPTPDNFDVIEVPAAEEAFDLRPMNSSPSECASEISCNPRSRSGRIRVSISKSNAQTIKKRNLP